MIPRHPPPKKHSPQDLEALLFAAEIGDVPELDLHGDPKDLARERLSSFIHQAWMRGTESVRVVHGHGTGLLRDEVRKVLQKEPLVAGFRDADGARTGALTLVVLYRRPLYTTSPGGHTGGL
jgi:dsDNA-specific endonuclease/ATPase MutS2